MGISIVRALIYILPPYRVLLLYFFSSLGSTAFAFAVLFFGLIGGDVGGEGRRRGGGIRNGGQTRKEKRKIQ